MEIKLLNIIAMWCDLEKEITIVLKHKTINQGIFKGKITASGDDYIEFTSNDGFPKDIVIPIDEIMMFIPSEKNKSMPLKKKRSGKDIRWAKREGK